MILGLWQFLAHLKTSADIEETSLYEISLPRTSDIVIQVNKNGTIQLGEEKISKRVHRLRNKDELRLLVIDQPGVVYESLTILLKWPENLPPSKLDMLAVHGVGDKEIKKFAREAEFIAYFVGERAMITIVAEWPKGTFKLPFFGLLNDWLSLQPGYVWIIVSFFLVFLGLLLLAFLIAKMFFERKTLKITVRETPPSSLPPAIVGVLVKQRITSAEILATLIDLANRGYLFLLDKGNHFVFISRKKDYLGLYEFEKALLEEIFQNKEFTLLEDYKKSKINSLLISIYDLVFRLGFFVVNPRYVHLKWRLVGIICSISGIVGVFVSLKFFPDPPYTALAWVGIIIAGLIIFDLARGFTPYTTEGLLELKEWLSFAKYLSNPPLPSINNFGYNTYIRYLPYAIVLGQAEAWSMRFADLPLVKPAWFDSFSPPQNSLKFYRTIKLITHSVGEVLIQQIAPEID